MERLAVLMEWKTRTVKLSVLPKMICRFHGIPIKIPASKVFVDRHFILKFGKE